jgi:hypothetical protein
MTNVPGQLEMGTTTTVWEGLPTYFEIGDESYYVLKYRKYLRYRKKRFGTKYTMSIRGSSRPNSCLIRQNIRFESYHNLNPYIKLTKGNDKFRGL